MPRRYPGRCPDLTWEQARATALRSGAPLPAVTCTLPDALGHALAAPLGALCDLPPFDTSAMDGWAVAGAGPWRLRGDGVLAGAAEPVTLGHGTAVPVATGAPLPAGATAVLRTEHAQVRDGVLRHRIADLGGPPAGRDVRPRGQECRSGETLLPAGTTVTPAVLGLAAAAGCDHLSVHRRPSAELLVLGDELLARGVPRGGRVRDALGPMVPPWLDCIGARTVGVRRIGDDLRLLQEAVRSSPADVVVTTGSTAAGPVDFLHDVLRREGAVLTVDSVAVRPGHPMLLAELPPAADGRARRLVGLPGNPLAAAAAAVTLLRPLLRRLGGHADPEPLRLPAAADLAGHPHDTRLLPVRHTGEGAVPLPFDGPAMLRGLALADGLAVVPPGGARAGAHVRFLRLPGR
ncbi:molybdopterin molybdotransferase MoeA [Streptomyces sp. NPDC032940]|uniref:molybdopterin molybdotransferase MoeA n=1 Tax=Streptomyces sp. NPDC032940 TaxID=3155366 RepID=UPI0033E6EA4C